MCQRKAKSSTAVIFLLVVLGNLAVAGGVQISPVNTAEDLDLSGDIVYAVNFGNNGNPEVGGIVFSQDQECPAITLHVQGEGPATWWGPYPGTGDAGLDELLNGLAYRYDTPPLEISIDAGGLTVGRSYVLQIIGYEPESHSRNIDIIVEDEEIVTGLDPIIEQGGFVGKGGLVIKYQFVARDSVLNIRMLSHINACAISGFILSTQPIAFADYASGTTIELVTGRGVWQLNWGQGPWTWSNGTGDSLLGPNVSGLLDLHATAPADVSADLIATLPIAGTLTLSAHDPNDKDLILGTMVLSGTGVNVIDINASRVLVDEGLGMLLAPFHPPGPRLTLKLDGTTGIFAYVDPMGDWDLSLAGLYAAPLIEGLELQDNILAALGGEVPLIGGIGEFALTGHVGQYIPNASMTVKSFCEYGTGVALQFGAGGGLWDQTWSGGANDWYPCTAPLNMQFLGEDVVGLLETTTTGAPLVDENLVLSFDFSGQITLTAVSPENPADIISQIVGDVDGTFVADLNADHATLDDDGNIVVAFGWSVHDGPDAKIRVTEATGIYSDIKQVGTWQWYVNGTVKAVRLPDLPLQTNILGCLEDDTLLLGAEEEFVLTGLYYRDSHEQ